MATRNTSTQVTFQRPFILSGFTDVQMAGTYTVDTEEEQIEGISFPAWVRTGTVIQIARGGAIEHIPIEAKELHEAMMRDGAQESPAHPASTAAADSRRKVARATRLVTGKKF